MLLNSPCRFRWGRSWHLSSQDRLPASRTDASKFPIIFRDRELLSAKIKKIYGGMTASIFNRPVKEHGTVIPLKLIVNICDAGFMSSDC